MSHDALRLLWLGDRPDQQELIVWRLQSTFGYRVDSIVDYAEVLRSVKSIRSQYDVALINLFDITQSKTPDVVTAIHDTDPDIEVILLNDESVQRHSSLIDPAIRTSTFQHDFKQLAWEIRDAAQQTQLRRERRTLNALQDVSRAINSSLDLEEILQQTCRAAVELFGVDHGGVIGFDASYGDAKVIAEYPEHVVPGLTQTLGTMIPVRDVPAEERLIRQQIPLNIPNIAAEKSLGPVQKILLGFGIQSILIVPIVVDGKVIASFSLDTIHAQRSFTSSEVDLCQRLADQASIAIKNARLIKDGKAAARKIEHQAEKLKALYEIGRELASDSDVDHIFNSTARHIVHLVGARRSLVLFFDSQQSQLLKVSGYGYPQEHLDELRFEEIEAGISGWVIKHQQPVRIDDAQTDPRNTGVARLHAQQFGSSPLIVGPLRVNHEIVGTLTAANEQGDPLFTHDDLVLVEMLADLAAVAIKNAQLLGAAQQRAEHLEALRRTTLAITSSIDDRMLLNSIVEQAVKLLRAKSGGIYSYYADSGNLEVIADYMRSGYVGNILSEGEGMAGRLVQSGLPYLIIDDYNVWAYKSDLYPEVRPFGAMLGVPLRWKNTPIGVLYIDDEVGRKFMPDDAHLLGLFADQAAVAIKNGQFLHEAEQRAKQLEALRRVTLDITSPLERDILLSKIVKQAAELLRAKSGGIFEYLPERGELIQIANYNRPVENIGKALQVGEGLAGLLVQSGEPFMIIDNYNDWPGRADFADHRPYAALLEVPLEWQGKVIGVLFIDDAVGRQFTHKDAELLRAFADQAATALVNAELTTNNEAKLSRLERLAQATKEIVGNLGNTTREERLMLIAKHTAEILDAETCSVHLVKRTGYLSLEVSYGHRDGHFPKGEEVEIRSGPQSGLTGHIAYEGKLFNARADVLVDHFAIRGYPTDHLPSRYCYSKIAIPLMQTSSESTKLIGLLRAQNKKGKDGTPHPSIGFTKEDEWILTIFAEAVVVAIENDRLIERLSEQTDHMTRLTASAPDAIVANDALGNITAFNQRAAEILGYTESEALGRPVSELYATKDEPHDIRLRLQAAGGRLIGHETVLVNKNNEMIPIRLSATSLYDSADQFLGVVGYFEDLRTVREVERRIELLLRASNTIVQAQTMTEGLQKLAEMMVSLLTTTFCRILLTDDDQRFLISKAAHFMPRTQQATHWTTKLNDLISLEDWPGLRQILRHNRSYLVSWSDADGQLVLKRLSQQLGLTNPIRSLLLIPLKIGDRIIGLVELGELRHEPQHSFTKDRIELAYAIASQTTALIDNSYMHEVTRQRNRELEQLHEATKAMVGAVDHRQVLQLIVERVRDMLHADSSALWSYDNVHNRFVHQELLGSGIPQSDLEKFRAAEPKPGQSAATVMQREWIGVTDIDSSEYAFIGQSTRALLKGIGVKSYMGIVLKVADELAGVLYVNYKLARTFSKEDRWALENFAAYAALALKRSRLHDQVSKAKRAAEVVAHFTVLGNREETLSYVAHGTKRAIGCDAVTLFVYHESTNKLDHPPQMAGVLYPDRAARLEEVARESIVYQMIEQDKPYIVEDVRKNALFRDKRFSLDEGVKSCVAIPLEARGKKVGVMFVNYRTLHRFTTDELNNVTMFANQAAVAIHNAQLFSESEALHEASKVISGSLELKEILDRIAEQAWKLTGQTGFANIRLVEKSRVRLAASFPREKLESTQKAIGDELDLLIGVNGRIGVTGRAVVTAESQLVNDVTNNLDYLRSDHDTLSELAAPIKIGERVIGVVNVEHPERHTFDNTDKNVLEALAAAAATAIRNAQLHAETRKREKSLEGLYDAGKAITSTLTLEETLLRIAEQALEIISNSQHKDCFSHVSLVRDNRVEFIASYPEGLLHILQKIRIRLDAAPDNKPGIVGRAIRNRQSQNVGDVRKDKDYIGLEEYIDPNQERYIRSQLSVPLKTSEHVIGVISVEHPKKHAFSDTDVKNIEALAAQAAIAIENARRYAELEEAKSVIAARTALAWTGMITSTWGHTIGRQAQTIREQTMLLRRDIAHGNLDELERRIEMIDRIAGQLVQKRITRPLVDGDETTILPVNEFVEERLTQFRQYELNKTSGLTLSFAPQLSGADTISVHPELLRRALDILIENAIDATTHSTRRVITILTRGVKERIEIVVKDSGPGIPIATRRKLFTDPIIKDAGSKGSGMGLMLAQMIAQNYGGEIRIGHSGRSGTTMILSLPSRA